VYQTKVKTVSVSSGLSFLKVAVNSTIHFHESLITGIYLIRVTKLFEFDKKLTAEFALIQGTSHIPDVMFFCSTGDGFSR